MPARVHTRAAIAALGAALLLTAPAARAQVFDFEAAPPGFTPLVQTSGGVTATFGNTGSPQLYEVLTFPAGSFALLANNVLGTTPGTGDIFGPTPLEIVFDRPLTSIALAFALTGAAVPGTQLTLTAFLGANPVGNVVAPAGVGPNFPEGISSFNTVAFDRVLLTSDGNDFAIDDVAVTAAVLPEPATVSLVGSALVVLAVCARRRRRTA